MITSEPCAFWLMEPFLHGYPIFESNPRLLDFYLSPIWWLGVVNTIMLSVAMTASKDRTLGRLARRAGLFTTPLYGGISLCVLLIITFRVHCAYLDADFPIASIEACRRWLLRWVCEIGFLWGASAVLLTCLKAFSDLGRLGYARVRAACNPPGAE